MKDGQRGRPVWRRSRSCSDAACVEVMRVNDGPVFLRSSLNPEAVLRFTADEWSAFRTGMSRGDFD